MTTGSSSEMIRFHSAATTQTESKFVKGTGWIQIGRGPFLFLPISLLAPSAGNHILSLLT